MEQYNQASKVVALRTNDNMQNDVSYVFVKQYDSSSRFVRVEIWDEAGKIPISGNPKLNVLKPDGTKTFVNGRINDDNQAVVLLTPNVLEYGGQCACDLSVVSPYPEEELFEGDGVSTTFVSKLNLTNIEFVNINGAFIDSGWTYSNSTHTLSFDTAPNLGDAILIKGTGTQVLTSSTFYIIVEESNYSIERS